MRVAAIWTVALLLLVTVPAALGQGIISTVAGKPWVFTGDGGPATNAPLGEIVGVTVDSAGNVYAADLTNGMVVKITPAGLLSVVASNLNFQGYGAQPTHVGLAVDSLGNLYIVESGRQRVLKVTPPGAITAVAGNGTWGDTGDGGPATAASMSVPTGIAVDQAGNIYIANHYTNRVRKVDTNGIITTVAGNGTAGSSGDNGPATSAQIGAPSALALDGAGNLYIVSWAYGKLRKVDTGGIITTVSNQADYGVWVDANQSIYLTMPGGIGKLDGAGNVTRIAGTGVAGFSGDGGPASSATLSSTVFAVAVDSNGTIYAADYSNQRVRKITAAGTISTLAGNGKFRFAGDGGPATQAVLRSPAALTIDAAGDLIIADSKNQRIRKVNTNSIISTIAGVGSPAYSGDNGPATAASLSLWDFADQFRGALYAGLVTDAAGNVYVSDNNRVRKIDSGGTITTIPGGGSLFDAAGLAFDSAGNLYVASSHQVRKVNTAGTVTTIAGTGASGFSGDSGAATLATLNSPRSIAIDPDGNIYIADTSNYRVRKVDMSGIITTFAGNGTYGSSGDNGPATSAQLAGPNALALDTAGNLYIADGSRIRRIDSTRTITTVAGTGTCGLSGDGGLATAAALCNPYGLTLDPAGNLYIADTGNDRIRKITNPSTPAFGLTVSPASQTVNAGLPASFTVTITAGGGFSGSVALSCSGLPTGALCGFSPNPATPGTSALTVSTSVATAAGTYSFAITGTSAVTSFTTTATLIVGAGIDFTIGVSPSSASVAAGLRAAYTVTITPMNGFTGAVALSCSSGLPSGASCSFLPNPTAGASTLTVGTSISTPLTGATLTITGAAGALSHSTSTMLVVTTAATPASLAYVSGNNQSGPAGAALPNPLVVKVTDSSGNPIAGVTVSFTVTAGGGTIAPASAITGVNGQASAGWVLGASGNTASASVSGVSPVTFSASVSPNPAPFGPGITTVAGTAWSPTITNGPALNATLGEIRAVIGDSAGNAYASDNTNNIVFKVSPSGTFTVVAGTGSSGFSGDDGPATSAQLSYPIGLALDASGNLYIADTNNRRIRKVNLASGIITTIAGTGVTGNGGDGGPATAAQLSYPFGIAVENGGALYIADRDGQRIRRIDPSGTIGTVAGTGVAGYSGDNGPATTAQLTNPRGVAVDSAGNLYIGDSDNGRIRRVDGTGTITAFATANSPYIMAIDAAGNIYFGDGTYVRRASAAGVVTILAGTGTRGFSGDGGPATAAQVTWPVGAGVDALGNVYVADTRNYRVRKINTSGTITTIAGNGGYRWTGDGGPATSTALWSPSGVARDASGNLYIADTNNHRIRKVTPGGTISTFAGNGAWSYSGDAGPAIAAGLAYPLAVIADAAGNLYVADRDNCRVRMVSISGAISTFAGTGSCSYSGDAGPATNASMNTPRALALGPDGSLYIAEGDRVRKVNPAGIITTVAGTSTAGYSGDGSPATAAQLSNVNGVVVDSNGNVYIGDTSNNRVRRVDPSGIITTVAGTGVSGAAGDGGPATTAQVSAYSVALDASGNLYIAGSNHRVRRVSPASGGVITTYAGTGTSGFAGDGGYANQAWLSAPVGLWADSGGLYIADTGNHRIRLVSSSIVAPDFTLSVSPSSQTTAAGLSATYTVTIAPVGGFALPVNFTCGGLPFAATCSFSPNPAVPGTATMTVGTKLSTPGGTSTITITGTSGSLTRTATTGFTVSGRATAAALTIVSGDGQTGPAGSPLPNPLIVRVSNSSGQPISGQMVTYAVTAGGGTLTPTSAFTDINGLAQAGWTLGVIPGANTATASLGSLSPVTLSATGVAPPAGPGITTIAGSAWVFPAGGPAASAPIGTVQGTAVDAANNLYVADSGNHMVFKITPSGTLSIVAGSGIFGAAGDGGSATAAQLNFPNAVAVDSSGNVYIADRDNHRIRRVTPGGTITTLAGGSSGYAGDSGPVALAQFYYPSGVAVDASGNLYIADRDNHVIRKIAAGGIVSTVAGNSTYGYSGDGGAATAAQLNTPNGVAVDGAGNLYIADTNNHRIRQVTPAGTISTVAGTGTSGSTGDGGPATSARLNYPTGVTLDPSGNLYIADQNNNKVRKVSGGTITTLAGTQGNSFSGDGGPATNANLFAPYSVAVDSSGNVHIADTADYRVRKVDPAGTISTFAGNGLYRFAGDGGPGTSAQLSSPRVAVTDAAGNIYIADNANSRVRKIAPGGAITTIAGTGVYGYSGDSGPATLAMLRYPSGLALDSGGNLYVSDQDNHRVRKIDASGVITTVVGTGAAGFAGDAGPATAAQLNSPHAIASDAAGNLYIADTNNRRIRKVTPGGTITTVAGSGTSGYSGDGGSATSAQLRAPWGVAVDGAGNLYIAERDNHTVRKADPSGTITTLAGTGSYGCSGNGVAAASSTFYQILSVAADSAGNVYFADEFCHRVRKVTPAGVAVTVAGTGSSGFSGDGGPARLAQLRNPHSVWVDSAGNLYIADAYNHRIRLVSSTVAVPDFTLSLAPSSRSIAAGLSTTYTATIGALGGFSLPVGLSCSGLPVGASCTSLPNPAPPGTSTLTFSPAINTPPGTWTFTVIATSGSLVRTATANVTTAAAPAPASLAIVSGDNQSGPAGSTLPNPLVVKVTDASGNPIAGVSVTFAASAGGSLSATSTTTAGDGTAGTTWTLRTLPGSNTATATVAGLPPVTLSASGTTAAPAGPGIITVAGSTWVFTGAGGPATNAPLGPMWKITGDAAGNLFVTDHGNYMVFKITPAGILTVIAGNGTAGFSGDGGPATQAQLWGNVGIAVDLTGNVYITDQTNQRIRKIDTSGIITTVAGTGTYGYSGDGGPATKANLGGPNGIAVDASGNLYIADSSNCRVRKVTTAGVISTVAGTGVCSFTGDGGPATAAQLYNPNGVAFDAAGNLYISDRTNNRIRKVDLTGTITTVAGTGTAGYTNGSGSATGARLNYPNGLVVDAAGTIYFSDVNNHRVRKVTSTGAIGDVAGNGVRGFSGDSGPATSAMLNTPYGVWADSSGNVYIADSNNYRIRKVTSSGVISTIAGNGQFRFAGDGGPATNSQLYAPYGVVSDAAGNFYIADSANNRIRKVTPGGTITTIAGTGAPGYSGDGGPATAAMLYSPYGVALDTAGNIYIADTNNNRIRKVDSTGTITTVAGTGSSTHSGDGGPATAAGINMGAGVAVDATGNLYIADWNNRIRKVTPAGIISTVAGSGTSGYAGDGGPATLAQFRTPYGITVDSAGNIYIADQNNYRIRKVDTGGTVTTVAGTGTYGCSAATGLATTLTLTYPWGLAVDPSGNLYFADLSCYRVRKLSPNGVMSTVAGTGSAGFSGDGGPAISAMLNYPSGIWLDGAGDLFIADSSNYRIRKVSNSIPVPDFTVAVSPGSASLPAGLSSNITTTVNALNGFNSYVTLGCAGLPSGASCSFSPRGLLSGTSTLTLSTSVSTPAGTVSFSVTASGGGLVRVAPISLTVTTAVVPASLVIVSGNNQTGPAGSTLPNLVVVKALDAASNPISGVPISLTVTAGGGSFRPTSPTTGGAAGQAQFAWTLGSSTGANSATASVTGLTPVTLSAIATAPLTGPPITTIAGRAWLFSGDGGPATSAWGIAPMYGVTAGPSGSVYVAASENNLVFKVSSAGILNIVAGNGTPGFSGDGGLAISAQLNGPYRLAVDAAGNLYIADLRNHRVRKVSANGTITTVAGNGTGSYSGDGGPATAAGLVSPAGLALDAAGNLYIADMDDHRIRKVNTSGIITTVGGIGIAGYYGDGGQAAFAQFSSPRGLAIDSSGNIYVADGNNNRIRRINTAGTITTVAGNGNYGYSGDGGLAVNAWLAEPLDVALDSSGSIYIVDRGNNRIRKITSGTITTVVGNGAGGFSGDSGPATAASLDEPAGVSVDSAGNIYIADGDNFRVRKVATSGIITTIAGNTDLLAPLGDGGPATAAFLLGPGGLAMDTAGSLYIAEAYVGRVRKVTSGGTISTYAGGAFTGPVGDGGPATAAMLSSAAGLAVDSAGNLYIATGHDDRIRKVTPGGIISTIAGVGSAGFSGDGGPATAANLNDAAGLALDAAGNLYFADRYNQRIRKIDLSGTITTVAGNGAASYYGDTGPAMAAAFNQPGGIAFDGSGNLYIADQGNNRIRKIDTGGIVTTVAGSSMAGCSGDGGPALGAALSNPSDLRIDPAGNLYIVDTGCNRIRMVTPGGIITTVAGTGVSGFSGDGGPAVNAQLASPAGILLDAAGNVLISDQSNLRVRKVWSVTVPPTDFALSVSPMWRAAPAGGATSFAVTLAALGGFSAPVSLTCGGLPTGASCTFSPNPANPGTATLTVGVGSTLSGMFTFSVTGTSGSLAHTEGAGVTVTPPPASLSVVSGNNQIGPAGATLPNLVVMRALDANGVPVPGAQVTFATSGGAFVPSIAITDANGVATAGWTLAPAPGANSGTASTAGLSPVSLAATGTVPGTPLGISTVAGSTWNFYGNGGPATAAPLGILQAVTMDSAGNVYGADAGNNIIVKISPAGTLTVVAGNGAAGYGGDGGPATAAQLNFPSDMAVYAAGNLYIADSLNNRIRKVDAAGNITTVAGNGTAGFSGDGGPATAASLKSPYGISIDSGGNIYIADSSNNRIRRVSPAGTIATVAGGGVGLGDGGPATSAMLAFPIRAIANAAGDLYIADFDNARIRKVNGGGIITTVAGNGAVGYSGDGGSATQAQLNQPWGLALDAAGNLYIPDSYNSRLRKVDISGVITTIAGTGVAGYSGDGGPATAATLYYPESPVIDASGNIYLADTGNGRIRKITPAGSISNLAGNGAFMFDGDGGPAIRAHLNAARAIVLDGAGNLVIADSDNYRIRKVDSGGTISTVAGVGFGGFSGDSGPATQARFNRVWGLAVDSSGNLYLADRENFRVRKITPAGVITTIAGNGVSGSAGDGGPATLAQLNNPKGLALDSAGNLYIGANLRLRKVSTSGVISTVAGTGVLGYSGDGGPAISAQVGNIMGVRLDAAGNVYFADTTYNVVRKIDTGGIITTVAGNGASGYSGDGGPATGAQLRGPNQIGFDAVGNLYISEGGNYRVRMVTPGGVITTVAGNGVPAFSGDGGVATVASLSSPNGLAVDSSGNIYIGDGDHIRKIWAFTNAVPAVSALTPATVPTGPALTLIVTGSGFSQGSVVRWNGSDRPTTFVSTTQLTAAIPASDLPVAGTAQITVFSPAPGGGLSNAMVLTIVTANPLPVITSISPVERTAGSGGFPLTVSGLSFVAGATVQWAGSPRPTTYVSDSQLTAQISDADAATAGMFLVTVVNPGPGGGTSAGIPFTIHPAGSYLVGDASPASGNDSGHFGDESLDNLDLILALRAVTSVPGFLPPNCSDLFDAMDSYPTDGEARGGDGSLDNLDLIATLRRVTNADTSRPRRTPRGLICSAMAPGLVAMLARPSEVPLGAGAVEFQRQQPAEDGAERVAVYLSAYRDLDLGGLSLALGWTDSSAAAQAPLRFVSATAGAPALLDNQLPGAIAAAWLGGLQLRAGQRLLLGFVHISTSGQQVTLPVLYGAMANDRATGARIPLELPRRERSKQ